MRNKNAVIRSIIRRNKKEVIGSIFVVAAALIMAVVILCPGRQEKKPEFIFSYAENQTKDYPTTMGGYKFAEMVEEQTDGRIKILVQAEGELGYEKDVIRQLQIGGIDFTRVSLAHLAEYIPKLTVLQMPYLYTNSNHMWRVLDGRIGDDFLKSIDPNEVIGLSWYDAGARNFYNSVRPVKSLEDIAGLRIRVQESSLMSDIVEALGAEAIPLDYADVYSGIQRGEVDGAENNWPSYETMGHYEVAGYYTIDEHTRVPEVQLCSEVTWNKLTPEDQVIIRSCAEESALYERELWRAQEIKSKHTAIDNNVEVSELSASEKERFQEAVKSVYKKYCADYMDVIEAIIEEGKE
nr:MULTISPECIES: TRAP transporter substrate-binding protein [Robinsoniella]